MQIEDPSKDVHFDGNLSQSDNLPLKALYVYRASYIAQYSNRAWWLGGRSYGFVDSGAQFCFSYGQNHVSVWRSGDDPSQVGDKEGEESEGESKELARSTEDIGI